MRKLLVLVLGACLFARFADAQQPLQKNPFFIDPPEWTAAQADHNREAEITDSSERGVLQVMYQGISGKLSGMRAGTTPLGQSYLRLYQDVVDQNALAKLHKDDVAKYDADYNAYLAAGGGGTYRTDDPKYAMLVAWYGRLQVWYAKTKARSEEINANIKRLDPRIIDMNSSLETAFAAWKVECKTYTDVCATFFNRQSIRIAIAAMQKKLDQDKRELSKYKEVPGFYADVEKMAKDAEQAREDGQMLAIDKLTSFALENLSGRVSARATVQSDDLKRTMAILAKHKVAAKELGLDLAKHVSHGTLRYSKLLDMLGKAREIASAASNIQKREYLELIASILGNFVETPVLKLAIANAELYTSLLYTGWSYATAKARVNQLDKLTDSKLKAIAAVSGLYKRNLLKMADLQKQLAATGASS